MESKVMSEIEDQVYVPEKNISPSKHHLLPLLMLFQTIFTSGSFLAFISEFISQYKATLHKFPFPQTVAYFVFFKAPDCHGF